MNVSFVASHYISLYVSHISDYMHRWILKYPSGTRRIHHILRSDNDRHLHDHPFDFRSVILWGGYWEETPDGKTTYYGPGSIIRRKGTDLHRLTLAGKSVWTFVTTGPYYRKWGFQTEEGWIEESEYYRRFQEKNAG